MSLPTVVDLGSHALRAGPANADEPPPVVTPAFARGGGDGGARRALGRGGALAAAAGGDADALEVRGGATHATIRCRVPPRRSLVSAFLARPD